jgi:hypothetical protein
MHRRVRAKQESGSNEGGSFLLTLVSLRARAFMFDYEKQKPAGAAAGPARDRNGGFSETVPRPDLVPSFTANSDGLSSLSEDWRRHARIQGYQALRAVAPTIERAMLSKRSVVSKLVSAEVAFATTTCIIDFRDTIRDAAEVALGVAVESRVWACVVVRAALGLQLENENLATVIGAERMFYTAEFRLFLREWNRFELSTSGAMCERGWGLSSTKYLSAGVWGVTYLRCISEDACAHNPHVVIKLAGLPAETHYVNEQTHERVPLGEASLHAGYDIGIESFMNEAVRLLVARGVTPHIIIGYGSWVCDNFETAVRPGKFPMTAIDHIACVSPSSSRRTKPITNGVAENKTEERMQMAKGMVGASERRALCENILKDVGRGAQSKNLPVMAQEEVLLGMEDALKDIAKCVPALPIVVALTTATCRVPPVARLLPSCLLLLLCTASHVVRASCCCEPSLLHLSLPVSHDVAMFAHGFTTVARTGIAIPITLEPHMLDTIRTMSRPGRQRSRPCSSKSLTLLQRCRSTFHR